MKNILELVKKKLFLIANSSLFLHEIWGTFPKIALESALKSLSDSSEHACVTPLHILGDTTGSLIMLYGT